VTTAPEGLDVRWGHDRVVIVLKESLLGVVSSRSTVELFADRLVVSGQVGRVELDVELGRVRRCHRSGHSLYLDIDGIGDVLVAATAHPLEHIYWVCDRVLEAKRNRRAPREGEVPDELKALMGKGGD